MSLGDAMAERGARGWILRWIDCQRTSFRRAEPSPSHGCAGVVNGQGRSGSAGGWALNSGGGLLSRSPRPAVLKPKGTVVDWKGRSHGSFKQSGSVCERKPIGAGVDAEPKRDARIEASWEASWPDGDIWGLTRRGDRVAAGGWNRRETLRPLPREGRDGEGYVT